MKIALIMLAAGNSRRFGSNKLLYEIDGKPMYRHILEKLMVVAELLEETCSKSLECDENRLGELKKEINKQCKKTIGLSVGSNAKLSYQNNCYKKITVVTQYEEIEQAARALGANVYINPHPDEGISSSLKIGLKGRRRLLLHCLRPTLAHCRNNPSAYYPPKNIQQRNRLRLLRWKTWQSLYFYKKILR